ncbi:MAG: hypothetical protein NVS3B10_06070 [Polyangiales bacterium]
MSRAAIRGMRPIRAIRGISAICAIRETRAVRPALAVVGVLGATLGGCGSCTGGGAPPTTTRVELSIEAGRPGEPGQAGKPAASGTALYGKANTVRDGLDVILTAHPTSCRDAVGEGSTYVRFQLAPGPGGTFFVGHRVGVEVTVAIGARKSSAAAFQSAVDLEPFALREGERLRGAVSFEGHGTPKTSGGGRFDVEICKKQPIPPEAAQPTAVDGPVAGKHGDRSFSGRSAIVELREPQDGPRYVEALEVFPDAHLTCGTRNRALGRELRLSELGAASPGRDEVHAPQPAAAVLHVIDPPATPRELRFEGRLRPAWIRFDALEFERGTRARGALFVDALALPQAAPIDAARIGGTFEALVCPWADDDPPTPTSAVDVTVGIDALRALHAAHARAIVVPGGLDLVLTADDHPCRDAATKPEAPALVVRVATPRGPGKQAVSRSSWLAMGAAPLDALAATSVELTSFALVEYAHVRGQLHLDGALRGGGAFDAIVCEDENGAIAAAME